MTGRKKLLYKFCSALSVSAHYNHCTHPELSEVKILIAFNIFSDCFLWILHYAKTGPQRTWLNSNYQNAQKTEDIFYSGIFHRHKLVTHNFKIRKISAYSSFWICLVGLSVFIGRPPPLHTHTQKKKIRKIRENSKGWCSFSKMHIWGFNHFVKFQKNSSMKHLISLLPWGLPESETLLSQSFSIFHISPLLHSVYSAWLIFSKNLIIKVMYVGLEVFLFSPHSFIVV